MRNDSPLPFTPSELAREMGISRPFASQVISGARSMPRGLAIRIWRWKGVTLGPIAGASAAEIEVLERFEGQRA